MAARKTLLGNVSSLVENWQSGKSVTESLRFSLDHKILCDVTFNVGMHQKRIQAHKLILSLRSSVLMSMMNGAMSGQDIIIPDIEPAIFEKFLLFLYTDQIIMDGSNVIGLLYASRKYHIKNLEEQCMRFLDTSMTSENACLIMEQAHLYDEPSIKEKSFKMICENGDAALKSDTVMGLCGNCLDDVIQSDELKVSEQTVFEAILTWSETACRNLGKEVTPKNRRHVLGEAILHVQYPLLSQDYFEDTVLPKNLLTVDEGFKIMKHFLYPNKDVSPFITRPRNPSSSLVIMCITRFDTVRVKEQGWSYSGTSDDGIMFSINTKAALLGFQLYGARNNSTQTYNVTAFLTTALTDEIMDGSSITTTVVADKEKYDILFAQAVYLKKDVKYNLIVNIKGPDTYFGVSSKSVIKYNTITCSFFDYKSSKHSKRPNATRVSYGQIPGLLFHV